MTNRQATPLEQFVRAKQTAEMLCVTKVTVWNMVRDGRLPRPAVKLSSGATLFRAEEVRDAIERLACETAAEA